MLLKNYKSKITLPPNVEKSMNRRGKTNLKHIAKIYSWMIADMKKTTNMAPVLFLPKT